MSDREEDLELITVLSTNDLATITIAESLLEDAEIPYLAKGEGIQDLFGLGRLVAVNPLTGPVELRVLQDDHQRAQSVLADLLRRRN